MHEEVIVAGSSHVRLGSALNLSLLKVGPLSITAVGAIASVGTILTASIAIGVLTLTSSKSPPTCIDDAYTTYKNGKYLLDVLHNDYDIKGSNLLIKSVEDPFIGNTSIVGNRIQYISDRAFGTIKFNYTVTNGWLDSTCQVTLDQKNNAPQASDISLNIPKNKPYMLDVSRFVKDIDGDKLYLVNPSNDGLQIKLPGYPLGKYNMDYTVSDGIDTASAKIIIDTYNMRPKAIGTSFFLNKDYIYDLPIMLRDYDPDGDPLELVDIYNICDAGNMFMESGNLARFIPTRDISLIQQGCPFQYTITDGEDRSTGIGYIKLMNQNPSITSKEIHVPKNKNTIIPIDVSDPDLYDVVTITDARDLKSDKNIQIVVLEENIQIVPYMNQTDTIQLNKKSYGLSVNAGIQDLKIQISGTDGIDVTDAIIDVIVDNQKPICQDKIVYCIRGSGCYVPQNVIYPMCQDPDGDSLEYSINIITTILLKNITVPITATDPMHESSTAYLHLIAIEPPQINQKPACQNTSIVAGRNQQIIISKLLNITDDNMYILRINGSIISDITYAPSIPGNYTWQIQIDDSGQGNWCNLQIQIPNQIPHCNNTQLELPHNRNGTYVSQLIQMSDPDRDQVFISSTNSGCSFSSNRIECIIWNSKKIHLNIQDSYGATSSCYVDVTLIFTDPVAVDNFGNKRQQELSIIYVADLIGNDYDPEGYSLKFNSTWFSQNGCSCVGCCDAGTGSNPTLDSSGSIITFQPNRDRCGTMKFQYKIDRIDGVGSAIGFATYKIIDCQCKKPMDIVLVWDGSGSISSSSWKQMKSFGKNLASKMQISDTQVRMAVIQFSTGVYADTPYGFGFQSNSDTLSTYLSNMKQVGGSTNIRYGLSAAQVLLQNSDRSVDKAIVLITDGDSNKPTGCDSCDQITVMGTDGSDWCTQRIRNYTGSSYTCSKCDDYPRACVDPRPHRQLITSAGINLVALGIGDSISSVGQQDLRELNGGELLSVSWNDLDTIYSHIVDLSCV